jgi:hypothetical protein
MPLKEGTAGLHIMHEMPLRDAIVKTFGTHGVFVHFVQASLPLLKWLARRHCKIPLQDAIVKTINTHGVCVPFVQASCPLLEWLARRHCKMPLEEGTAGLHIMHEMPLRDAIVKAFNTHGVFVHMCRPATLPPPQVAREKHCKMPLQDAIVKTFIGLARTIYIRFIYGIFGREITKYTVIYGVYVRFWPTLDI